MSVDQGVATFGARFDNEAASGAGAVYVYRLTGGIWEYDTKITASDAITRDHFGMNALRNGVLVVGASGKHCSNSSITCGGAYIYRNDGSNWVEEAILVGSDTTTRDGFGHWVATDGTRVLIGSWGDDDVCPSDLQCNSGSAYVFSYDGQNWVEEQKLTASDAAGGVRFGNRVGIDGEWAAIAGYSETVYLFRYNGLSWIEHIKLTAPDGSQSSGFGSSIDIQTDVMLIGSGNGAYLYKYSNETWNFIAKLTPSDPAMSSGAEVSFSGNFALVGAPGVHHMGTNTGVAFMYRVFGSPDTNLNGVNDQCEGDCNNNGIPDAQDILDGTSLDCNLNEVPDECEPDCNNNNVADSCDIADETSPDCSGNGIPDECEPDCNASGFADSCDILNGTSQDCTGNGLPDECEPDCNSNQIADSCDIQSNTEADCNNNAIPDSCDIVFNISEDCSGDGVPDECDPDCNFNGTPDSCDIFNNISPDIDSDGIPDECENWAQCQTGEEFFDYTPHRVDVEAEQMAMRLTGELRAPEAEYLRFSRDLQIIRNHLPELVYIIDRPRFARDQLIVRFEDTLLRTNYNALNSYYSVIEERLLSATLDIWVLTFCDNLNMETLFLEYSALPEVRYAEPNRVIGDGDNIEFEQMGTTLRYTIAHGFGDCPSGCICSQQWVLEVDLDGNLNFVSYQELGSPQYCAFEEIGCCLGDEGCRMMLAAECVELGGTPLVPVTNCDALNDVNVDSDDVMECYASETAVAATIPAVSTWGLIVLALTVLIGGTVCIRRIPNFTTNHS